MAYKPILFNTEMVQAIQAGRKTQTRRLVKPQPETLPEHLLEAGMNIIHKGKLCKLHEPYGYAARTRGELIVKPVKPPCRPGDILWMRETWRPARGTIHTYLNGEVVESDDWHEGFEYKAGGYHFPDGFTESNDMFHFSEIRSDGNWRPSIHMPKEAARIFLRVKDVRVERLHEITEEQAVQEGCSTGVVVIALDPMGVEVELDEPRDWTALDDFECVWNSTIKPADKDKYGWAANPWVWVIEFERCEKPEDFGQAIPEGGRPGHEEGTSMA